MNKDVQKQTVVVAVVVVVVVVVVTVVVVVRYDAESVLTAVLHVSLRLQDVRSGLPQRRRSRPRQPRVSVLRRDAGKLRRTADLAVPPASDAVPTRPARHSTPRRQSFPLHVPASDKYHVGIPTLHRAFETRGSRQPLPCQRYAVLQGYRRHGESGET